MSKYYKQVGELNDWRLKVQENIENNTKLTDAVATHFSIENQVLSLNKISEVLLRVLDGHEYNRLIDFVNEKQTYLAKKKLVMSKDTLKDRIMLSCRALKEKQPLPQMPEKIPDDKLPPADMNQMLSQMKAKDQKKKSKKKLRSISSSRSNGGGDKSDSKSYKRGKSKGKSASRPRETSSVSAVSSNARHGRKDDKVQPPKKSKTKSKQSDGRSTSLRTKKQPTANFKELGIDVASLDKSPIQ